jgi:hypothetical protein
MAAGMRGGLGVVSWILLGGAVTMMFFVILSGFSSSTPLDKIYFLQADTSGISGARSITQWTYFYVCGAGNQNCGSATAALPFGYAWLGNTAGAPAELIGDHGSGTTSTYYFYIWRFGWVFYLMGLTFACLAIITGLLSCTRLASGLSSLFCFIATFWTALAAALMTVEFVKARDVFRAQGHDAQIGTYAFAFTWASVFALFLASILFFGGCFVGRKKDVVASDGVHNRKFGLFGRNKSVRSKAGGSFIDNESQRRVVKEEY